HPVVELQFLLGARRGFSRRLRASGLSLRHRDFSATWRIGSEPSAGRREVQLKMAATRRD
ncbi:MAG TPA: hypothetical protein VEJ86_02570, partial [Candidatus Binataceae bacterium]|nr:hypothetical protein [Candidatus Binataceae bacterium]